MGKPGNIINAIAVTSDKTNVIAYDSSEDAIKILDVIQEMRVEESLSKPQVISKTLRCRPIL